MSFAPQVTFDEAGGDTPHSLTLAAGQNIRVYSIAVRWDGSGAGGSFLACCSIYSQDGKLLSRTRPEQTFAAGDTGVVTYAPFLHSEPETPATGIGPAFIVNNQLAPSFWNDVWYVPAGLGSPVKVTSNPSGTFPFVAKLSPDGAHIAFVQSDGTADHWLYVMDVGGSNVVQLSNFRVDDFKWADNDTLVYRNTGTTLRRRNIDGSGLAVFGTTAGLATFGIAPDGLHVAYIAKPAADYELWTIGIAGAGNTKLATLSGGVGGDGAPVYTLDGSAIVFSDSVGVKTIAPDGTGLTTIVTPAPTAFWYVEGMEDTRLFVTDTANHPQWRLARIVLSGSYGIVAPTLFEQVNVHGAAPNYVQGRIFTVQDGPLMGGVDSLVSVLPDGSDLRHHFDPDESGAPLFQNVFLE